MEKVCRAIQRIDDETRLVGIPFDHAAFFHHKSPIRPRFAQFIIEHAFSLLVGLRNEIGWALLRNLQMLHFAKVTTQLRASLASSAFHDGEKAGMGWH